MNWTNPLSRPSNEGDTAHRQFSTEARVDGFLSSNGQALHFPSELPQAPFKRAKMGDRVRARGQHVIKVTDLAWRDAGSAC